MPALANPPANLPRFVPHIVNGGSAGAGASSGSRSDLISRNQPSPAQNEIVTGGEGPAQLVLSGQPAHIAQIAHDARNVLSGLMLYCELVAVPGVLAQAHAHYAQELQAIAQSVAQIVERMALAQTETALPTPAAVPLRTFCISDAAQELRHLQPLLAAIAGPSIRLSVAATPCAGRIALSTEELTRILVNLVRNAADALPAGGDIRIAAQYCDGPSFPDRPVHGFTPARSVSISISDDGPGIPEPLRERIFELGFTTRSSSEQFSHSVASGWPARRRRGLGLSIVRNLVESAGGTVRVSAARARGACFEINLPVRDVITSGTCAMAPNSAFAADGQLQDS
jgi:two-component system cell cycle sensor histidine kinase/response regulator CckA